MEAGSMPSQQRPVTSGQGLGFSFHDLGCSVQVPIGIPDSIALLKHKSRTCFVAQKRAQEPSQTLNPNPWIPNLTP